MVSKITFKLKLKDLVSSDKLDELTKSNQKKVLNEVSEFVIDRILEDTSKQLSSVTGRKWKGIDPKSAHAKAKGSTKANMEYKGAMLDALKARNDKTQELTKEIGIFVEKQALKADGHTHAGLFGTSKLPTRKFMPVGDEKLRAGIMKDVISLAKDLVEDSPKKQRSRIDLTGEIYSDLLKEAGLGEGN